MRIIVSTRTRWIRANLQLWRLYKTMKRRTFSRPHLHPLRIPLWRGHPRLEGKNEDQSPCNTVGRFPPRCTCCAIIASRDLPSGQVDTLSRNRRKLASKKRGDGGRAAPCDN